MTGDTCPDLAPLPTSAEIVRYMRSAGSAVLPWLFAVLGKRFLPKLTGRPYNFYLGWTCSGIGGAAGYAGSHQWPEMAGSAFSSLVAAICWWLSRRKRKRSAKLIGGKSRALLAAVVARMRETAKPRQVLRPVPGGAHA